MISRANKGIIYPSDISIERKVSPDAVCLPITESVPCCAYQYCKEELEEIFYRIGNSKPSDVFVFGILRKGKINFDDGLKIYTNSDCPFDFENLEKNDDVCSEEYCGEILLPFTDVYFPDVPVYQFLSNTDLKDLNPFISFLKEQYPQSVFLMSKQEIQHN